MKSIIRNSIAYLVLSIALIGAAEMHEAISYCSADEKVKSAEELLQDLDRKMIQDLSYLQQKADSAEVSEFFREDARADDGISYYHVKDGILSDWTDSEPVLNEGLLMSLPDSGLYSLPNGFFLVRSASNSSNKFVALLLVKHDFAYENRYLKNEFNPKLGFAENFITDPKQGIAFHAPDGRVMFKVRESDPGVYVPFQLSGYLYFISLLLFILFLFQVGKTYFSQSGFHLIFFSSIVIVARILMKYLDIPGVLYNTDLFNPRHYAESYLFSSTGDLLLNSIVIAMISLLVYRRSRKNVSGSSNKFTLLIYLPAMIIAGMLLHTLISGIVLHSKISFDVSDMSGLSEYTLIAAISIAILLASYTLLAFALAGPLIKQRLSYGQLAFILLFFAVYASLSIFFNKERKEREARKVLAQKADIGQDFIAEHLLSEILREIRRDSLLWNSIRMRSFGPDQLVSYLNANYFSGYLSRYEINANVFDSSGRNLYNGVYPGSITYYNDLISTRGKAVQNSDLTYIQSDNGRQTYVSRLDFEYKNAQEPVSLVMMMNSRFFRSDIGFPELFVSGPAGELNEPGEYSLARYHQGELVYQYGSFTYAITSANIEARPLKDNFTVFENYSHYLYKPSDDLLIIVSRPVRGYFDLITLFSWLFAFFSFFFGLSIITYRYFSGAALRVQSLTRKIQLSLMFLVILSFILIGSGTVFYIYKKYESDQKRSISEQVNALWFYLGSNFGLQSPLSQSMLSERENQLNQMVRNLNVDFNLYDERGRLFYSSQPKLFEQHIISERMNYVALHEIKNKGRTQYILPESIGRLNYIAAYAPFTDRNGSVTAYLNLPYFEKQNELNREISGFLSALVNIYVFLFALAMFLAIIISGRITKPLLLIQERMGSIILGRKNEPIAYSANDEIGHLVAEYNRMLEELARSADKLAKGERESAWREMAKQVAHEIKNPLTPMKLSIQHLQKVWKENHPDREKLLQNMSETLIRQIDALSHIAEEFSNFAQMPKARVQDVELTSVLTSVIDLFSKTPQMEFSFEHPQIKCFVKADRDQLERAFSNLIKNAIQSIPEGRMGLIRIGLGQGTEGFYRVSISDNGIGIPENQRDKIFRPNFTTKSSGMGLGLSLVKNIIDFSNGRIWYSSEYNNGSSFFVELPVSE
ncbi:MAG: sensor histidine kinase [Bacteroidetes bacterium]|nr:MAG: sensor histidine kinase [Bacteroidota bacterium]